MNLFESTFLREYWAHGVMILPGLSRKPKDVDIEIVKGWCSARCSWCLNAADREHANFDKAIQQTNGLMRMSRSSDIRLAFTDTFSLIENDLQRFDPTPDTVQFSIPKNLSWSDCENLWQRIATAVYDWVTPRMHLRKDREYPKINLGIWTNTSKEAIEAIQALSILVKSLVKEFAVMSVEFELPSVDIRTSINDYPDVDAIWDVHQQILEGLWLDPRFVLNEAQFDLIQEIGWDYLVREQDHFLPGFEDSKIIHLERDSTSNLRYDLFKTYFKWIEGDVPISLIYLRTMHSKLKLLKRTDDDLDNVLGRIIHKGNLSVMFEPSWMIHLGHSAMNIHAKKHKIPWDMMDHFLSRHHIGYFMQSLIWELQRRRRED